jgi:hypothetical protein
MANINQPSGFTPVGTIGAAGWNGVTHLYYIPSTDGSLMAIGDPVKVGSGSDAGGVPLVVKAGGTDAVRGVITGFLLSAPNNISLQGTVLDNTTISIPATKSRDYYALVSDDPNTVYSVQGDSTATLQVAASSNLNASFTVATPANTYSPSASVLTSSTFLASNTLNLRCLGLERVAGNTFGAYARWLVKFNLTDLANGATGA